IADSPPSQTTSNIYQSQGPIIHIDRTACRLSKRIASPPSPVPLPCRGIICYDRCMDLQPLPTLSAAFYPLLFASGAVAGLVDAIAGGGGLITLPMLLALGIPPQHALGTNKLQSSFGSGSAF